MSEFTAVLVSGGAAGGTLCRYAVGQLFARRSQQQFPWGTWTVNVLGTLLLCMFYREFVLLHADADWWNLLGTGFCGGFTTFSALSVETVRLYRENRILGFLYITSSVALGLLVAWGTLAWL